MLGGIFGRQLPPTHAVQMSEVSGVVTQASWAPGNQEDRVCAQHGRSPEGLEAG